MKRAINGTEFNGVPGIAGDYRARYVRADVLDEIVIVKYEAKHYPAFYSVEGVRYNAPNETYYDIADFDTLADAEKFLADLIADINSEGTK